MVVAALDGRADLFERLTRREIADAGIGHPCWGRDLHPLEWQLASLHGQTPPTSPSASHSGCTSMTGSPRTKRILSYEPLRTQSDVRGNAIGYPNTTESEFMMQYD